MRVDASISRGSPWEVFLVFLRLGCVSFGGPIAHLGYFQKDLVSQRAWCDESTFAELLALAQSLPGPSSSQVCFGLGVFRAGWLGGIAAWTAFTLPSALLMFAFAFGSSLLSGKHGMGLVHGLQLVAVAVVAQAVLTMQRSLAPDRKRILIALLAVTTALFTPVEISTFLSILAGGVIGSLALKTQSVRKPPSAVLRPTGAWSVAAAILFGSLLLALPLAARLTGRVECQVLSAFYRTGASVFGGGHVVLPLLENTVVAPGWVDQQTFLTGYGAAQALPGPLFTLGAFLGASASPTHRILMGSLGLLALSAPGLLLMATFLPLWQRLRAIQPLQNALAGVNAAVVGVLIAALYKPLWTSAIRTPGDFWCALVAFVLLTSLKVPPWAVVITIGLAYTLAA